MKDKVYVGKWFKHNKRLAVVMECLGYNKWLCAYLFKNEYFIIKTDEIINSMKDEETKDRMKFEYKFYEKNLAPKWLEGDYDLHIEGNRMVMTSKDGKQIKTRCHPDDDWRLQVGLDELKERMTEKTKPIKPIKLGGKVRFKKGKADWYYPHHVNEWCDKNKIPQNYIFMAYMTDEIFTDREDELEKYDFVVMYMDEVAGMKFAYILNASHKFGLIVNVDWLEAVE